MPDCKGRITRIPGSEDLVAGEASSAQGAGSVKESGEMSPIMELVSRSGFTTGMVVQELGWDDDVDDDLRLAIENTIDGELIEDAVEAVDAVLLWWRADDGDVTDGVVDALTDLDEKGFVWVLTPKVGRPEHVDPADLSEAATTAGLSRTSTAANLSADWSAVKLERPRRR